MPTREGSVLCTVCLSSPGDRSGRDPLGREGRSSSTRNEVLVASGEEAGGGEVKGAGAGCCGSCVNGYMEKPPSPQVAPWSPDFLRSHASVVEFQVCIPGKQQPTMQAWEVCKGSGVGCRLLPLVCVSSGISKRGA